LVRYETPPQFSYGDYENPRILDRFNTGTRAGVEAASDEIVTIPNPSAGIYYIVVIADSDIKKSDMAYSLSATTTPISFSAGAKGCSLGSSAFAGKFDPIFYLLLLVSVWRIRRYSQMKNNPD
jgi:hypothetical protein